MNKRRGFGKNCRILFLWYFVLVRLRFVANQPERGSKGIIRLNESDEMKLKYESEKLHCRYLSIVEFQQCVSRTCEEQMLIVESTYYWVITEVDFNVECSVAIVNHSV